MRLVVGAFWHDLARTDPLLAKHSGQSVRVRASRSRSTSKAVQRLQPSDRAAAEPAGWAPLLAPLYESGHFGARRSAVGPCGSASAEARFATCSGFPRCSTPRAMTG
jgi:hypothetical protein